jgi:dipeptidyl-peptidase-4
LSGKVRKRNAGKNLMAKQLSRILITLLCITCSVQADDLTLERVYGSPDISGTRPVALRFSPDGTRVTYLRGKQDDRRQQDLWEYHIADGVNRLLVDSKVLVPEEEQLDEVEKARRERMRISGKGIVEYVWAPDGKSILFPLAGDLYLYDLSAAADQAVRQLTDTAAFETDAKVSEEGHYVSFVRAQNLFAIDLESGAERQLTSDGGGTIRNGMAEFIAMEEMDRDTGYWWSPDDKYVALTQVDESPVELAKRYQIFANSFKATEERYPFTGENNVFIRLAVLELATGKLVWVDLGEEEDIYLARVDWTPDSSTIVFQRQSRDQKRLDLMAADPTDGKSRIVLTETSDVWINLHNNLRFLEQSPGEFIWTSERSGYQHLYRYDLSGRQLAEITSGNWVVDELLAIDEDRGVLFFGGFANTVLEKHLYEASVTGDGGIRKITSRPGWHNVVMAESGKAYIDSFSSRRVPPRVSLHAVDGSRLTWLVENPMDETHPYFPYMNRHQIPEIGSLKAEDGQTLYHSLLKPVDFDPDKRYPAIVFTYGGPGLQIVDHAWGRDIVFHQYLQQQGYIVFSLDNRGSANRGTAFEFPIYRQMSVVEARDQKRGVEFLRSMPFVDPDRIGIYGWSYGGYMTLMAMMQAPGEFKVGVSGAPVTDWRLYDTHYTERYMSTPSANPEGYDLSNVVTHVEQLRGPLLVIHGMADDNVLLNHSTLLFREMQKKGVQFESMLYPGETHGLRDPDIVVHRTQLMVNFLNRHLKVAPH